MAISQVIGGTPSGWLVERVGYPTFFGLAMLSGLPSLVLLWVLAKMPMATAAAREPANPGAQ
jgi:hypothetical protein